MAEAFIAIDGEMSALRVATRQARAGRGVAGGTLNIDLDLAAAKQVAAGAAVWVGGVVHTKNLGSATGYLSRLHAQIEPVTVVGLGGQNLIQLQADVAYQQLQAIETVRTSSVELSLQLHGHLMVDGRVEPFWSVSLDYDIDQSEWIKMLGGFGFRSVLLLEMEYPQPGSSTEYRQARDYFAQARQHYLVHEWRQCVESVRQCLAAIAGEPAADETLEADVHAAFKQVRSDARSMKIAYDQRLDLVRRTLKFAADLGGHPEVAETTKADARALLLMAAGLLERASTVR